MSQIVITELQPAGSAFFSESENFLNDLTDEVLTNAKGGLSPASVGLSYVISAFSAGLSLGASIGYGITRYYLP